MTVSEHCASGFKQEQFWIWGANKMVYGDICLNMGIIKPDVETKLRSFVCSNWDIWIWKSFFLELLEELVHGETRIFDDPLNGKQHYRILVKQSFLHFGKTPQKNLA